MSTKHDDAVKAFMEKRAKEIAAVKARKEAEREAKAKAKREMLRAEREEYSAQKKAAREAEKAKAREESSHANAKSLAQATLTTYVKHKQCVPRELLPELHKEYLLEHVYLILAAEKDVSRAQVREALQTLLE